MRKTMTSMAVLLCVSAFVLSASADGDVEQSGENSDCADYNALYLVAGVHSPHAVLVKVTSGADYTMSASSGYPLIDFFDDSGSHIDLGGTIGTVPDDVAYGSICVAFTSSWPTAPELEATWTYSES